MTGAWRHKGLLRKGFRKVIYFLARCSKTQNAAADDLSRLENS